MECNKHFCVYYFVALFGIISSGLIFASRISVSKKNVIIFGVPDAFCDVAFKAFPASSPAAGVLSWEPCIFTKTFVILQF